MTKQELKELIQGQQIAALQTAVGVLAYALETGDPGAYRLFSDRMHFEMKLMPEELTDDDQRKATAAAVDSYITTKFSSMSFGTRRASGFGRRRPMFLARTQRGM